MGLFCMGDNTVKTLWQEVCITFLPNASKVFLSDSNEICTIGAHYDGDHITNFVDRDGKWLFFKFFLASYLSPPWEISN